MAADCQQQLQQLQHQPATAAAPLPADAAAAAAAVAHLQRRVAQFEAEREELLRAVERCRVDQADAHRLEWEARARAGEVAELQGALSDAQQFLFEERQRLLALQAENDELKLQELQDRRRIQQLLALARAPPDAGAGGGGGGGACGGSGGAAAGSPSSPSSPSKKTARQQEQQQQQAPRAVFLPTADADVLLLKVESLAAQLNEQRALHEERVASLLADRRTRAQEEERQRANLLRQVEALAAQVRQLEASLLATTRDYVEARRELQEARGDAAAAREQLERDVAAARADADRARRAARRDADRAASAADGRMREYVERFRAQVRARDEELLALRAASEAGRADAERRADELEGRLGRLAEANRQLELRRQLDGEGWAADVAALRKTLAAVDRRLTQMRLIERLEDDERLDALLDHLERRAPGGGTGGGGGVIGGGGLQKQQPKQQRQQQQQREHHRKQQQGASVGFLANRGGGLRGPVPFGGGGGGGGGILAAAHRHGSAAQARHLRTSPGADQRGRRAANVGAGDDHDEEEEEEDAATTAVDDDDGDDDEEQTLSGVQSVVTVPGSIKSSLAAELASVREQLAALEARAGERARRALGGVRGGRPASGGLPLLK